MNKTLSLLALLAAACWGQPKPGNDPKLLADGEGKDTVVRVCTGCHSFGNFTRFRKTEDQWGDTVSDMQTRGAMVTEKEMDQVVDYLAKHYGPGAKMNVNIAPVEEIKAMLAVTNDQAQAVIDYRKDHGNFASLGDVAKVPGLDATKLEAKKGVIAFQ